MSAIAQPVLRLQQLRTASLSHRLQPNKSQRRWKQVLVRAEPEDAGDLGALKADMERFQRNKQAVSTATVAQDSARPAAAQSSPNPIKEVVDKLLIADFFFIMLSLAWLAAGLGEKAALHSETLVSAWMPLWPLLFQPAIGVLMAGALVSGGIGWVQENWGKKQ